MYADGKQNGDCLRLRAASGVSGYDVTLGDDGHGLKLVVVMTAQLCKFIKSFEAERTLWLPLWWLF